MYEGAGMVDADLVLRFQQGEPGAFDALVSRHMRDAYLFALRLTGRPQEAEELAQDAFVSAFSGLRGFRGESTFRSWLCRILVNLKRDRHRSRKRYEARVAASVSERASEIPEGVPGDPTDLSHRIRECLESLPERQREVLTLHLYQDLGYDEIAQALGITYENVKVTLSLARKRLREELKEDLS